MIYLCTFGLEDPIRPEVKESINTIKYGHSTAAPDPDNVEVCLRMVTGDHLETAKYVAMSSGLLSPEEIEKEGVVLTAD